MNRREALRNIGLGAGFLVVGPSTFSLLQSCKSEPEYDWQPVFLSASHGFALKKIVDIIIPKTETIGASDLNIAEFIDAYMDQIAGEEERENFTKSAEAFSRAFKNEHDKAQEEGADADFEVLVKKYLKATPEEKKNFAKRTTETQDIQEQGSEAKPPVNADAGALDYLNSVRSKAIWAWKNSEEIGENVMWYDPVPAQYIPCGPVDELGGGKAMSL